MRVETAMCRRLVAIWLASALLTAAGLWSLSDVGVEASWGRDVLPGSVVLGLGLVAVVAPLTATVDALR